MAKYTESPSGGERHEQSNDSIQDAVKRSNSGLTDGGFYRPVCPFNTNDEMRSPTTSSRDAKGTMMQRVKINRGLAGKIKP